mgnify:CR=1 FL=1
MSYSVFPLVIQNVLDLTTFNSVYGDISCNWELSERTYENQSEPDSFTQPYKYNLSYLKAASIVKYKLKKHLERDITLCKINVNGQVTGQESAIHTDFDEHFFWTFVLFTSARWNPAWGGEFMCFDPINRKYEYVPCLPNSGVLFPSNWQHVGFSPNKMTSSMRTSLAFCYYETAFKNDASQKYLSDPLNFKFL